MEEIEGCREMKATKGVCDYNERTWEREKQAWV
jgi:hypothetical protein